MQEGRKANGECSSTRTILEGSMQTATSGKRMMLAALALALGLCLPGLAVAGEVVEYFHLDAVGNIRAVTDASGNVIERHDYLPFGDEWCGAAVCAAPTPGQPRRFTGKERDRETGYDYFGARYYSGRVGRFTGVDPVMTIHANLADPQRWNRYAYGLNNPYRYVDPEGAIPFEQGLDVVSLVDSVYTLWQEPTWANAGWLAWDVVGMVPYVPGSWAGKVGKHGALAALGKRADGVVPPKGPPKGPPSGGGGGGDGLFLPDEYYRKKADQLAPGQWEPYGRYERFDEQGNLLQVTTYDEAGSRIRQYDTGTKARHGEGVHTFEYGPANPRQDPGGGRRSPHIPLEEFK